MLAKVLDVLGEPINYQVLLEVQYDIDAPVVRYPPAWPGNNNSRTGSNSWRIWSRARPKCRRNIKAGIAQPGPVSSFSGAMV